MLAPKHHFFSVKLDSSFVQNVWPNVWKFISSWSSSKLPYLSRTKCELNSWYVEGKRFHCSQFYNSSFAGPHVKFDLFSVWTERALCGLRQDSFLPFGEIPKHRESSFHWKQFPCVVSLSTSALFYQLFTAWCDVQVIVIPWIKLFYKWFPLIYSCCQRWTKLL